MTESSPRPNYTMATLALELKQFLFDTARARPDYKPSFKPVTVEWIGNPKTGETIEVSAVCLEPLAQIDGGESVLVIWWTPGAYLTVGYATYDEELKAAKKISLSAAVRYLRTERRPSTAQKQAIDNLRDKFARRARAYPAGEGPTYVE